MFTFEPAINTGSLIRMGLALVAVMGAWYKVRGHLDIIEYRVAAIEKALGTLAEALISIASADKKIALIDQRVTATEALHATLARELADLRRGQGWIQGDRRANVDGEYKRDRRRRITMIALAIAILWLLLGVL